jgi:hypothetical protein
MGEQVGGLGEQLVTKENFGGTKRDLGKQCIYHESVISDLALDLSQNYYQIAFCSLRGTHPNFPSVSSSGHTFRIT